MPRWGLISNGRTGADYDEEVIEMFARNSMLSPIRTTALATVAALVLTAVAPTAASAGGRHYRGGGGAAAAAAFAGIVGTGLAIAAAQNRADYYDGGYGYGGGPVYVEPQPYYGGGYGGYDPSYGPGPHGYGTTVPYVNGHPIAGW